MVMDEPSQVPVQPSQVRTRDCTPGPQGLSQGLSGCHGVHAFTGPALHGKLPESTCMVSPFPSRHRRVPVVVPMPQVALQPLSIDQEDHVLHGIWAWAQRATSNRHNSGAAASQLVCMRR